MIKLKELKYLAWLPVLLGMGAFVADFQASSMDNPFKWKNEINQLLAALFVAGVLWMLFSGIEYVLTRAARPINSK